MRGQRIYISGPIKGNDDYKEDFATAVRYLIGQLDFAPTEVFNPVTIEHKEDATYEEFMREDLKGLLKCDVIYMLTGWERSQGAKLELLVATTCGITVVFQ